MSGIVTGGWSFVLAAYIVTGTALLSYALYTISDFRKRTALRAAWSGSKKGSSS